MRVSTRQDARSRQLRNVAVRLTILSLVVFVAADGRNEYTAADQDVKRSRQLMSSPGSPPAPKFEISLYTIWLYTIHGWLMAVAWGALAPAAILIAYKFKDQLHTRGLWFQLHRAMMALAYIMQLAGVALVSVPIHQTGLHNYMRQTKIHISIGLLVQCLAFLQVAFALIGRPHLDSSYRRSWNAAHWWNGRLLLLLGIVQIYDGLLLYRSDAANQWKFISLSAYLFLLFATAAAKDAFDEVRLPPPAAKGGLQAGKHSAGSLAATERAKQMQPEP